MYKYIALLVIIDQQKKVFGIIFAPQFHQKTTRIAVFLLRGSVAVTQKPHQLQPQVRFLPPQHGIS